MYLLSAIFSLFSISFAFGNNEVYFQPEQIHISFGKNVGEYIIRWSTMNATNISAVEYGTNGLVHTAFGTNEKFIDGGEQHREQYIHTVVLKNLTSEKIYEYHCGSELGWSVIYFLKTVPVTPEWSPSFAIFGDMGNYNAKSLPQLQEETQSGMYDAVFHVGDFAYNMDTDNARVGDEFMRQIEPIAAYVPYMTCPGNHEYAYNFSNYKARFSPPSGPDNLYYSFDIGPAHIISFNTEYYYFLNYGMKSLVKQYYWLENDLKEANKPENRKKHPWIITMAHRPMYCSTDDGDDCTYEDDIIRTGLPIVKMFGLEKLFYDYGVDLEIWAHEHAYERLWPVYDKVVRNGSLEDPYVNPKAPVHITTGSAGCEEMTDPFVKNPPKWSAFRSSDYGYTKMKIYNNSHLNIQQLSVDKLKIIDQIWLIKDHHAPYEAL